MIFYGRATPIRQKVLVHRVALSNLPQLSCQENDSGLVHLLHRPAKGREPCILGIRLAVLLFHVQNRGPTICGDAWYALCKLHLSGRMLYTVTNIFQGKPAKSSCMFGLQYATGGL